MFTVTCHFYCLLWSEFSHCFLIFRIMVCYRSYLLNMNFCRLLGCGQAGFTGKHYEWNSVLWDSIPIEFNPHASSGLRIPEKANGRALGPQLLFGDYSNVLMEMDSLSRLEH